MRTQRQELQAGGKNTRRFFTTRSSTAILTQRLPSSFPFPAPSLSLFYNAFLAFPREVLVFGMSCQKQQLFICSNSGRFQDMETHSDQLIMLEPGSEENPTHFLSRTLLGSVPPPSLTTSFYYKYFFLLSIIPPSFSCSEQLPRAGIFLAIRSVT